MVGGAPGTQEQPVQQWEQRLGEQESEGLSACKCAWHHTETVQVLERMLGREMLEKDVKGRGICMTVSGHTDVTHNHAEPQDKTGSPR